MVWLGEEQACSRIPGEVGAESLARSGSAILYAMGRYGIGCRQSGSQDFGV